jgi:hypothetical protein
MFTFAAVYVPMQRTVSHSADIVGKLWTVGHLHVLYMWQSDILTLFLHAIYTFTMYVVLLHLIPGLKASHRIHQICDDNN